MWLREPCRGVVVSIGELGDIQDEIEGVLAPYVVRDPAARPANSRGVRLMRYVLPEIEDDRP